MLREPVDLYYFSGTGNTLAVVKRMEAALKAAKVAVTIRRMEDGWGGMPEGKGSIGLAFPANSQAVSPVVWRFFQSLPKASGTKVFAVMTMNDSANVLGPLAKLLSRKGYVPFKACEISMPNNMLLGGKGQGLAGDERLAPGLEKADAFASEWLRGIGGWTEHAKGSAFVSLLSRKTVLPWFSMNLLFRLETDSTRCGSCGLCATSCPAGNIRMKEIPVHGRKCEFCMRCAAYCRHKAVTIKGKRSVSFRKCEL